MPDYVLILEEIISFYPPRQVLQLRRESNCYNFILKNLVIILPTRPLVSKENEKSWNIVGSGLFFHEKIYNYRQYFNSFHGREAKL